MISVVFKLKSQSITSDPKETNIYRILSDGKFKWKSPVSATDI